MWQQHPLERTEGFAHRVFTVLRGIRSVRIPLSPPCLLLYPATGPATGRHERPLGSCYIHPVDKHPAHHPCSSAPH